MSRAWCTASDGGVRLAVHIQPNAKKTEVVGVLNDALKLKLQAQPVDGQANVALIKYLARRLGVPRSAIRITHGVTSQRKLIDVLSRALTPEQVAASLIS